MSSQKQWKSAQKFLPRKLRTQVNSILTGIAIGSIATIFILQQEKLNDDNSSRNVPTNPQPTQKDTIDISKHEAGKYGLPVTASISSRLGYIMSYDFRTRNASWVLEKLTRSSLLKDNETSREKSQFMADNTIPLQFRVSPNDYKKSGYDKGHLAPARDMAQDQNAMNETFLMSNISPQIGEGFNRSYWKQLEGFLRHLANLRDVNAVYVLTGPLYLPTTELSKWNQSVYYITYPVIGSNLPVQPIAVPTHFFKAMVVEKNDGSVATAAFVLPNSIIPEGTDVKKFLVTFDRLEKMSGLVLFPNLKQYGVTKIQPLCDEVSCKLRKTEYFNATKSKSL